MNVDDIHEDDEDEESILEERICALLDLILETCSVTTDGLDNDEWFMKYTIEAFQTAFSSCGIERIIIEGLFEEIRVPGLRISVLKVLRRVLGNSVTQDADLVGHLLEHTKVPELHDHLVECIRVALVHCRTVQEAFDGGALSLNMKRKRDVVAAGDSVEESPKKKMRLDEKGSTRLNIVSLLVNIALEVLDSCFQPGEKVLATCSDSGCINILQNYTTLAKMEVICHAVVSHPASFDLFMEGISVSFAEICTKFCVNILSAAMKKAVLASKDNTKLTDPQWKRYKSLLSRITAVSLSPWIISLLSSSSSNHQSNSIEAKAHKEIVNLLANLDGSNGAMSELEVSAGNTSAVGLSRKFASFECSEEGKMDALKVLAKVYSQFRSGEMLQNCRAVVLLMELNSNGVGVWETVGEMVGTLNEGLWMWTCERLILNPTADVERLNIIARELGKISCSLAGTLSLGPGLQTCSVCECDVVAPKETASTTASRALSLSPWTKFEFLLQSDPTPRTSFIASLQRIISHVRSEDLYIDKNPFLLTCLGGLSSSSRGVRLATSDFVSPEHFALESNKMCFFSSMKQLMEVQKAEGNNEVLETCILSIGHLGSEKLLLPILYCLIDMLGDANFIFKSIAFEQIKSIAKIRNKAPYDLILPYLSEISVYLIDRLKVNGLLKEFSKVLGLSPKAFIERTISHTLPHLITLEQTDLIHELADVLNIKIGVLCVNQMSHVLKSIFMTSKTADVIRYVIKIAQLEIKDISLRGLILSCALELVTSLVIELGDVYEGKRNKAKNALMTMNNSLLEDVSSKISSKKSSSSAVAKKTETTDTLSDFLFGHFLGILSYVNHSLTDQTGRVSLAEKVKIVNGLIELMKLVKRLSSLIPQIMTTLQTALDIESIRNVALDGWEVFVDILGPQGVAPILNQIVGILMKGWKDCSESEAKHIVKIIESIVVRHADILKSRFNELCEFPRRPEFAAINAAVDPHRNLDIIGRLKRLLKAASHDNSVVVESALFELKQLLKKEQAFLHAEILSESVNDAIGETLSVLLETLKKYNGTRVDLQIVVCECLGALGAPDPSRIQVVISNSVDVSLETLDSKEQTDAFAVKFIEKLLAPAFRSATNPQSQAHLAFAIQELLQFCGFTPDFQKVRSRTDASLLPATVNTKLVNLWVFLPRPVLDVITPLLSTKYSIESKPSRPLALPIYRTATGFKDWLQFWVVDLMGKATGKYAKRILSVCTKVVESENIGIAGYLLPRLVLNILTGGSVVHSKELLLEFSSVLNDVVGPNGSNNMEKQQLSSQTIFQLIDYLTVWIRSRRRDMGKSRAQQRKSTGKHIGADEADDDSDMIRQRVASFLSGIPTVLMAEASYRSKSYARALLHYEQHIRTEKKIKSAEEMQPAYGFLQQIYSHMEEPDGIEGFSSIFLNPTLDQQILEHESAGRWTSAQTCYEICLQNNSEEVKLHTGLINCLKNLGHLGTMLTHINGNTSAHPSWSAHLNSFGIEAGWRLGSWDTLDEMLKKDYLPCFETDLGKILLHAKQKKRQDFQATLKQTREQLIAPLCAASMESYSRAYDCVVKLNMLHETEAACQHIWQKDATDDGEGFLADVMMKSWDTRLKITLPSLKIREPILNLRRILVRDLGPDSSSVSAKLECGRIWLQTAKALRAAGHFQPAYSAIVHATELQAPNAILQKAKWLSETNQPHKAIQELKSLVGRQYSQLTAGGPMPASALMMLKAKTLLMLARKMDETSMSTSEASFVAVVTANPK
ncbi:UNVERIFIED_CONTAM: serine/threonine-protein kinase M1 [Siphonaria sp. JEL0065]|nr:serine/threonine-protein kinase M1 [Siphonaria sp. JEL0065]